MTDNEVTQLGERMKRLEGRVDDMSRDLAQVAANVSIIMKAIIGDLDSPGGMASEVRENTKRIEVMERRVGELEGECADVADWVQDRSTIERLGKWVIGGGGVALGLFLDQLIRLATGG